MNYLLKLPQCKFSIIQNTSYFHFWKKILFCSNELFVKLKKQDKNFFSCCCTCMGRKQLTREFSNFRCSHWNIAQVHVIYYFRKWHQVIVNMNLTNLVIILSTITVIILVTIVTVFKCTSLLLNIMNHFNQYQNILLFWYKRHIRILIWTQVWHSRRILLRSSCNIFPHWHSLVWVHFT